MIYNVELRKKYMSHSISVIAFCEFEFLVVFYVCFSIHINKKSSRCILHIAIELRHFGSHFSIEFFETLYVKWRKLNAMLLSWCQSEEMYNNSFIYNFVK